MSANLWIVTLAFGIAVTASPAYATWGLIAADEETGDVGVAVAGCFPVEDNPALVPGIGALAQMAFFDSVTRDAAAALLAGGLTPAEVVAEVDDPEFDSDSEGKIYGVVALGEPPASFVGSLTERVTPPQQVRFGNTHNVVLVANVQVNGEALDETTAEVLATFEGLGRDASLADRLVAALTVGQTPGNDFRCASGASSAVLAVAAPTDDADDPSIYLYFNEIEDPDNAAVLLRAQYETTYGPIPAAPTGGGCTMSVPQDKTTTTVALLVLLSFVGLVRRRLPS